MKPVATIEIDRETGKRQTLYIRRESDEGRWTWGVYSRSDGEWISLARHNRSRQEALDAIWIMYGTGDWCLEWKDEAEGGQQ